MVQCRDMSGREVGYDDMCWRSWSGEVGKKCFRATYQLAGGRLWSCHGFWAKVEGRSRVHEHGGLTKVVVGREAKRVGKADLEVLKTLYSPASNINVSRGRLRARRQRLGDLDAFIHSSRGEIPSVLTAI